MYCDACRTGEGKYHVTLVVDVFNGSNRRKHIQFWLCEECERNNRAFLARDMTQRARVARAVCPSRYYVPAQGD